ncbi:MAG: glycosyltransferase family 1 protein [Acidimicrobiales bacterium]|nr:MAG: glycosyltransferase family 1 protein [Acidimicrobiales bacterium]
MTDPLRVGMNVLWLRPGIVGGTESYATRLITALADRPEVLMHTFALPEAASLHRGALAMTNVHQAPDLPDHPSARIAAERTWLIRELRALDADVVHHLGGTVPVGSPGPLVCTIHDLQPLDDPGNFSAIKRRWLGRALPAAVRRSTIVAAPSQWVADQISERLDIDPAHVVTVSAYADGSDDPTETQPDREHPFVLFPAMTLAHKNHRFLFDAFARAVQKRPDLRLVCVGATGRDDHDIRHYAADASSRIEMRGHVSRAEFDDLLHHAEALVFPSLYEGFGLPVVEAQIAGVPVIASNRTALPEVAGTGAVLLDPTDVDVWADAMAAPLPASTRDELVAQGRVNAQRYSAAEMATSQLRAYRLAQSTSPAP